jgi:Lon-like ATP-dependent protease
VAPPPVSVKGDESQPPADEINSVEPTQPQPKLPEEPVAEPEPQSTEGEAEPLPEPRATASSAATPEPHPSPSIDQSGDQPAVTTIERPPMKIPDTVHIRISTDNLKDYVGPPVYQKDRLYTHPPPPGVSTGLGYLGNGSGAVMPIEAISMPGKGGLQLTGKLGEVIRESAQIGLSWVKAHAYELGISPSPDEQFLADRDIHIHMPEGSIGKEGPSAGTAILTAFVSLFTRARVNPDIGMWFSPPIFIRLEC